VLPRWPRNPVLTADDSNNGWNLVVGPILCSLFTIVGCFFTTEYGYTSCDLWHVRASYIAAAVSLPMSLTLLVLPRIADSGPGGSDDEDVNNGDTELPTISQHADTETVMSEDSTIHLNCIT